LLQLCGTGVGPRASCPGRRTGTIVSGPGSDGAYRQWGGDPPPHHHVIGASWAVDGGLWLLLDRRLGERAIVLVHRDEENVDREVAAFAVDADAQVEIGDLAPDDSLIALNQWAEWPNWQTVIVDTRSGQGHLFDGRLGGFVAAGSAAGWVAGDGPTEAGWPLAAPAVGGESEPVYAPLPDLQEQLDSLIADRILLVHQADAIATDPAATIQVVVGPVEVEQGIGISLACSGPGEITVIETADGSLGELDVHDCLMRTRYHGHEGPGISSESATFQVDYDPSTTWRLVIYDPPPPRPRP
jgi:hypothetical protein